MKTASTAFATLGHPDRLAVLRLLMRYAPQGVRPTEIASALNLRQNTLSHHLADLASAGLIRADRQGRSLFYAVDLVTASALVGYLALDAGRGRPELLAPLAPPAPGERTGPFRVLFLCSGNSARSIFAEAILRDLAPNRFTAYSAGTRPGSELNPTAVSVLQQNGHETTRLRAKHLSEFQASTAPQMDFVFTVCDAAAAEECPPWPGQPITAHWGLPDPVKAQGTPAERAMAFKQTYAELRRRITAFAALPLETLDRLSLQTGLDALASLPNDQPKE